MVRRVAAAKNALQYAEQLPNLAALESDLKNSFLFTVGKRFNFGIEYRHSRSFDRINEVRTVLHLLFAFFAKDHARNLGLNIYRTNVQYSTSGFWKPA